MKGLAYHENKPQLRIIELPDPIPGESEVQVQIKAAAINHRDVWIAKGLYPRLKNKIVLGSDGAGILDGRKVLINPNLNWGPDPQIFSPQYQILGMPTNGTFAEKIVLPADRIHPIPGHLNFEQASALPLAGLTAYRVLFTKARLRKSDTVLITGIGGGVALMVMQFAVKCCKQVFVTSGSEAKLEMARQLGAAGGVNYKSEGWAKELKNLAVGFDVIIDSAGGDGFSSLIQCCNPLARVVIYGGTQGKINNLLPQTIFWKQLSILGSTMGNDEEFVAMLEFVSKHQIVPVVDSIFPLDMATSGFDKMEQGRQFGKIVFRI